MGRYAKLRSLLRESVKKLVSKKIGNFAGKLAEIISDRPLKRIKSSEIFVVLRNRDHSFQT